MKGFQNTSIAAIDKLPIKYNVERAITEGGVRQVICKFVNDPCTTTRL